MNGVTVAGKTGTAEFCAWDPELEDCADRDDQGNLPFHAWYVTYAPYEDPRSRWWSLSTTVAKGPL
ncbi:MAG: penicillin-binding transpeptidase domain-containing protein [Caldilineaceae bacterium]